MSEMKRISRIAIFMLVLLVVGCDKPHADSSDTTATQQNSGEAAPAVVNALSGDKKDLPLGVVPLTLRVPVEWNLNEAGGVTAIEGPLPQGDAEIVITRLKPMNAERTARWFTAATQPTEGEFLTNDVREINGLKVWETATVEHAATEPGSDATAVASWISWRFTILVPQDQDTLPCSLGFAGMSRGDYESQKDFIESIMGTIRLSDATGMQ
jgi:hypothetical protein